MTYSDFRNAIHKELAKRPAGATWNELRERLDLPYLRPCPEWTKRLEKEIGLKRSKGPCRALVWKVAS